MDRASEWDDHRVPKHGVSWCATWSASFIGGVRAHVRCAARVHSDSVSPYSQTSADACRLLTAVSREVAGIFAL